MLVQSARNTLDGQSFRIGITENPRGLGLARRPRSVFVSNPGGSLIKDSSLCHNPNYAFPSRRWMACQVVPCSGFARYCSHRSRISSLWASFCGTALGSSATESHNSPARIHFSCGESSETPGRRTAIVEVPYRLAHRESTGWHDLTDGRILAVHLSKFGVNHFSASSRLLTFRAA